MSEEVGTLGGNRASLPMRALASMLMRARRLRTPMSQSDADRRRAALQELGPEQPPWWVRTTCTITAGIRDGLPVYVVAPRRTNAAAVMMFLHGGGHSTPLRQGHWKLVAKLAVDNALRVVVPAYELAPQGTHREALDRMTALYEELAAEQAVGPYLAGDSSGGSLAYAVAQRIRDRGLPPPPRLFLFSPWLDATLNNPDIVDLVRHEPILEVAALRRFGKDWAGTESPEIPEVSPIFGDLTGLPPVEVFVGTRDLLVADCRALAATAARDGLDVRVYEYDEAFHVFMWLGWLPESRHVFRVIRRAVRDDRRRAN